MSGVGGLSVTYEVRNQNDSDYPKTIADNGYSQGNPDKQNAPKRARKHNAGKQRAESSGSDQKPKPGTGLMNEKRTLRDFNRDPVGEIRNAQKVEASRREVHR